MSTKTIYDMTNDDLTAQLLGKRVTAIDDDNNTITLDDGTVLELEDSSDCCAGFEAALKTIDLTDNAITAIRLDGEETPGEGEGKWTLTVLSVDKEVCAIEIQGDASNGYYCHSIDLKVTRPEPAQ